MIKEFSSNTLPEVDGACNICSSTRISKIEYTFLGENRTPFKLRKNSQLFIICPDCGYSFCPGNYRDDVKTLGEGNSRPGCVERIGDGITPGREYFMAMSAVGIFKKKIKILIFSPGLNKDHLLLRKHDLISECKITDLKNFQNSEYFLPIETGEVFDAVIVCEVVEHFMRPREEFYRLFSYLNKNGLLIISTAMRQQEENHSYSLYPFLTGHTSYYSFASVIHLARMNNSYIDFRVPTGKHILGGAKRYIYMTKNRVAYFTIINHFSAFPHPPSEYSEYS